jgi:hypothetical protein
MERQSEAALPTCLSAGRPDDTKVAILNFSLEAMNVESLPQFSLIERPETVHNHIGGQDLSAGYIIPSSISTCGFHLVLPLLGGIDIHHHAEPIHYLVRPRTDA